MSFIKIYRYQPVSQVPILRNFHCTQYGQIQMASKITWLVIKIQNCKLQYSDSVIPSYHGKTFFTAEKAASRYDCHGFFTGIDQIWINTFFGWWMWTKTEDTIFTLQYYLYTFGEVITGQHRHTYAQIYCVGVLRIIVGIIDYQ